MAHYKLPRSKEDEMIETENSNGPDKWQRQVNVPANKEVLDCCDVGDEVSVIITGKVVSKRDVEGDEYDDRSLTIEATQVSVPDNAPSQEEEALDAFNKGFSKALPLGG